MANKATACPSLQEISTPGKTARPLPAATCSDVFCPVHSVVVGDGDCVESGGDGGVHDLFCGCGHVAVAG